ncbi:MAG: flotillin domain-containing protein, partial [Gemmiger formicilis]|uniref:flotillin domain-containing protein n=1 Tax=Gemmiger formicilis TaxID=745368 RepID=UPI0039965748
RRGRDTFAKQQEAEGIALVGKAEAEAIRQKGLAEAEAMKQKAEAYKQYNDAAVAEMMIKALPEIARSVAQPLSSIDKVSIIGGDASGVLVVSLGNVPVLMAQTMEAMKEATGIDMRDIVRANSIEAKTHRNITIKTEDEDQTGSRAVGAAHVRPAAYRKLGACIPLHSRAGACPAPTEQ